MKKIIFTLRKSKKDYIQNEIINDKIYTRYFRLFIFYLFYIYFVIFFEVKATNLCNPKAENIKRRNRS